MDILINNSDGRVVAVAPSIASQTSGYVLTASDGGITVCPANSFSGPVSIVHNVVVPPDLVVGYNYNYVSGAFAPSGIALPDPPAPPASTGWEVCKNISSTSFIPLLIKTIGPAAYERIKTDQASAWVFDTLMKSGMILPNTVDPEIGIIIFQDAVNYLLATNGADGNKLLTPAQVTTIQAGWPRT